MKIQFKGVWILKLSVLSLVIGIPTMGFAVPVQDKSSDANTAMISVEELKGNKWVSTQPKRMRNNSPNQKFVVKVWFDKQFLGDGEAYSRRAKEFSGSKRTELRKQVIATLKQTADESYRVAKRELDDLVSNGAIDNVRRHWIVNGFSCTTTSRGVKLLKSVPGVKKIFITTDSVRRAAPRNGKLAPTPVGEQASTFDPKRYKHPWYCRALMAEKVWNEFGVTGRGTLNVVHDFNFAYPESLRESLASCVGYNFDTDSRKLTVKPGSESNQDMHGTMCAAIICGVGTDSCEYEFGIAPEGKWAGVIASGQIESSVEWAIEQSADTYSMSFSRPGLGDYRAHWRKIMEHGSFCGVYFVSGAGNFAQSESVPVQMRTPEDIPNAVFAAAGVHRDLTRTDFSSMGPVKWSTEHYKDGKIQKPEVCAFNHGIPKLMMDGTVRPMALNGNSFAGPMFCGSIALMVSADPDLLPWDLKEIITSTATDVGPAGVDFETGHGLINCYRAVKEVLRRKAIRESTDPSRYSGRSPNDELNKAQYEKALADRLLLVGSVVRNSPAEKAGLKRADVIVKLDGESISSETTLRSKLKRAGNSSVTMTVQRKRQMIELKIRSGGKGLGKVFEQFRAPVFK